MAFSGKGVRKTLKTCQDSQSLGQYSIVGPPEYKWVW